MNGEELKRKARAGGVVYGSLLSMSRNPGWAPVIASCGLDFVIVDSEHTPRGRDDLSDFVHALKSAGLVTIVRLPTPLEYHVSMAMDAGGDGIMAPYCETVEQVKEVAGATKLRPLKGILAARAMDTGELPNEATKAHLQEQNRNNVCIIGVESVPAIENLDAMLSVDGVDAIMIGPSDLTTSMGIPGQNDHPDYIEAVRGILRTCKAHNVPAMIHTLSLDAATMWLREGARMLLHSSDQRQLRNGFNHDFGVIKKVAAEFEGESG